MYSDKSSLWLGACVTAGLALLLLAPAERAYADCTPAAPVNNTAVTCTGFTSGSFGTGVETGDTITVVPGASVVNLGIAIFVADGTVINSGTVTGAGGGSAYGILAQVGDVHVINTATGSITAGSGAVVGNNNAYVFNAGTITGTSAGAGIAISATFGTAYVTNTATGVITAATDGVFGGTAAIVSNAGSLFGGNHGINAPTVYVTNTGSITSYVAGVSASNANVNNSGTIAAARTGSGAAIFASNNANVSNSGVLTGDDVGIRSSNTANISNSGTVAGGNVGIYVGTTGNVTNASTITGGSAAIQFAGGADTLTLLPGSKIIGAIVLGTGDMVSFSGGNHNLTFSSLAGATVTGTDLFAVSGNRAAAVDPTSFAANGRVLGDFSRSVSSVVPNFGNLPAATGGAPTAFAAASEPVAPAAFDAIAGLSAYTSDPVVFKAPTVVRADGTAIWARGFGGYRVQQADGVLLRTSSTFYGGALGVEKQVRGDLRVGGFVGAGTTRSHVELNTGNTDSTLGFGGIYARYFAGASFLYAAVQGGGSHNNVTRNNINNNLLANGLETATGSYSGWYVSPELKLGANVALGRVMDSQYTFTPSIGVRYLYGSFGGYTETGSTANLTVNSQTAQTVEERAELKLTRATAFDARTALLVDITGGALGIQRVGSNIVNAALLGQSIPFATPGKDDVWGGFGGVGMEWRTANVGLFASGEYLWLSDSSTVVSGKGGVRVAF